MFSVVLKCQMYGVAFARQMSAVRLRIRNCEVVVIREAGQVVNPIKCGGVAS